MAKSFDVDLGLIGNFSDTVHDGEVAVEIDATTTVGDKTYIARMKFAQPCTLNAFIARRGKRGTWDLATASWAIEVQGVVRRAIEAAVGGKATKAASKKATYRANIMEEDD